MDLCENCMTICFFGIYDPAYSRNRVLLKGLQANGIEVLECRTGKTGLGKYFDLIKKHRQIKGRYDYLLVAFPGQTMMLLAKILSKKTIIFDAFTSLYDSSVYDRQEAKKWSFKALKNFFLDWLGCFLADIILTDTKAHASYFQETFKARPEKFRRVFVGSDFSKTENKKNNDIFTVFFFGSSIPLQGVEYILQAAKILEGEDMVFNIIGTKIKNQHEAEGYENIKFFDNVPYESLAERIQEADVSLGIFGDTAKAKRVIPNKVFAALAVGAPIITGESEAAQELLQDRDNVLFVKMADAHDLAEKIKELKNDSALRQKISQNGYELFKNNLEAKRLVKNLLYEIKS